MAISSLTIVDENKRISQGSNIGIEDFLKILTTQLNNQDPLKPVDNQEFVAQIAQFANLEQSRQLNVKIDTLLATESAAQSVGLIGKRVIIPNGFGTVSNVSMTSGSPLFTITLDAGGFASNVKFSDIQTIRN